MLKGIYNIRGTDAFADTLAACLIDQHKHHTADPLWLARCEIYLPTRRATRTLQDAFLRQSAGKAAILPQFRVLGESTDDDIYFNSADHIHDTRPILTPLQKQRILAQIILTASKNGHLQENLTIDFSLKLAASLSLFLDDLHYNEISVDNLAQIIPESFSTHWQISANFLNILVEEWQNILHSANVRDPANVRTQALLDTAKAWQDTPPEHPIIIAGTTATIATVRRFIKSVLALKQGSVVLPDINTVMDDDEWNDLPPEHPQSLFRDLLRDLDLSRDSIKTINDTQPNARHLLAQELMRPPSSINHWQSLSLPTESCANLGVIACTNQYEEATIIAAKAKMALSNPDNVVAITCASRPLSEKIKAALLHYDITIDDSAGIPAHETNAGSFVLAAIHLIQSDFAPGPLLSLLKHSLCRGGMQRHQWIAKIRAFERDALCGPRSYKDYNSLLTLMPDDIAQPIKDAFHTHPIGTQTGDIFLKDIITTCEKLCAMEDASGTQRLWHGDAGQDLSAYIANLMTEYTHLSPMLFTEFAGCMKQFLSSYRIRPRYGVHPRLSLLGLMEARLYKADIMILAGLNETIWPDSTTYDPWFSRPMRQQAGLPPLERETAITGHDFLQGFQTQTAIITYSRTIDDIPADPSRWLLRLEAVLQATNLSDHIDRGHDLLDTLRAQQTSEDVMPAKRPQFTPPLSARPQEAYATDIEMWLRDPYAFYAKKVLNLRKWDLIDRPIDGAVIGNIVHETLYNYYTNSDGTILGMLEQNLRDVTDDAYIIAYAMQKFTSAFECLEKLEESRKGIYKIIAMETRGETLINGFTIQAKADRIDMNIADKSFTIIDYKTGATPTLTSVAAGTSPQLVIEALITNDNGYGPNTHNLSPETLEYWPLQKDWKPKTIAKKDSKPGKNKPHNIDTLLMQAHEGITALVDVFANEDTAYISLPIAQNAPDYQNYAHLARVKAWSSTE